MTNKASGSCKHKIVKRSFMQHHAWLESMYAKGEAQTQCAKCKLWLFKEEM